MLRANEYSSVDNRVNLHEAAGGFFALPGNGLSGRDQIGSTAIDDPSQHNHTGNERLNTGFDGHLRQIIYQKMALGDQDALSQNVNESSFSGGYTQVFGNGISCLLYTSPSPRDRQKSRMPSSA